MSSMKILIVAVFACMLVFAAASPVAKSLPFGNKVESNLALFQQNNPTLRVKRNIFDDALNEMEQIGSEIFQDAGEDTFQDDVEPKD